MKNTKKRGFTIVELVIVIAVIAILAAVLIPTFSNVIQKANESNALQAARNGWTAYTADNPTTFSGVNGYIKFAKDSNNTYWYEVKDGQFQPTLLTASTTPKAPEVKADGKIEGHTAFTDPKNILPTGVTLYIKDNP